MKKVIKLALIDFKLIFRDPSLRPFLFFPIILLSLIAWALPALVDKYDFLMAYIPVFLAVAVMENTQMFSFISSMVLIDEKESEVAKVYGITPLTKFQFLVSRFMIPYFFTVVLNIVLVRVQPFYLISLLDNLLISFLTALVVPVYVLGINSIVKNRMQGMVYIKAFNMIVLIPIAAFFVPEQIKNIFGILPTHWVFQSIDHISHHLPIGLVVVIGFLFFSILLWFVARLFFRKHFI